MNKVISPEERRLIDEAIALGKVQKIPTGKSGMPEQEMIWSEKLQRLVFIDKEAAHLRSRSYHFGKGRRKDPKVAARRERVKRMAAAGKTRPEIIEALNMTPWQLNQDIASMGIRLKAAKPKASPAQIKALERREKVAQAHDGTRTNQEIADMLGLTRRMVSADLKAMGMKAAYCKSGPKNGKAPAGKGRGRDRT